MSNSSTLTILLLLAEYCLVGPSFFWFIAVRWEKLRMRLSILRFLTIRVLRVALLVRLSMEVNPLRYFEVGIEAKWPNFLADVHFHLCVLGQVHCRACYFCASI